MVIGEPGTQASQVLFGHQVGHLGGRGQDLLNGTASADRILGGQGGDRLAGSDGADVMRAGAGDDSFDPADSRVAGGNGEDTLPFAGRGNNSLILSLQDLLQLSDPDTRHVDGNRGNRVASTDQGWTLEAENVGIGSPLYGRYVFYRVNVELLVDADINANLT